MRKLLIAAVAAVVTALALPSIGQADDIQSITANLTPAKRSKKKFKPAKIYVEILTKPLGSGPNPEQPPSAFNTKVNFPKNAKFDPKAVPRCKGTEAQLQNTTTEKAKQVCGNKSIVSKGSTTPTGPEHTTGTSAWVTVDLPGPNTTLGVPVVVTAFNGTKKNTLFLHSRADSVNNTSVLVGKLKTGKKAPKGYGSQLDVTIPPLLAGAISRFTTTVKSGKYVQARCKTKSEKWQAITSYDNHAQTTDDYVSKCKQK
ncbi:MAG TPA: hypothetical protein VFS73_07570 [Solirubrobacterales bacterium]|jgi:hypothetical protein|nr:hypothetical protein [Solirubrobacterales bacterium]